MKACLARDDSLETILAFGHRKKGYGHDIPSLWAAFKGRRGAAVPAEFDKIIEGLHAFEDIRYPEHLIEHGAMISFGLFDAPEPTHDNSQRPERSYTLQLPQIDRLMGLLFEASDGNPKVFLQESTDGHERFLIYYETLRATLLGRDTAGTSIRTQASTWQSITPPNNRMQPTHQTDIKFTCADLPPVFRAANAWR